MLTLGWRSYINGECRIHFAGGVVNVAHYTSIADRVTFLCGGATAHACRRHPTASTFPFSDLCPESGYPKGSDMGAIRIGSDCWIGAEAMILGGVTIADGVIVGARAVVAKDVPPFAIVVGNPARVVRYRYDAATIASLLRIAWWNWPEERIVATLPLLADVGAFVERFDPVSLDS